ncbi:MAG: AlpA family phage regulatory protein [Verrucomicrobiaceae bacterium]|nr:MAG: AlpA family phage regulatory protein [Verrucomicrobiaceae bacterium]
MPDTPLLRLPAVIAVTQLSRSTIYSAIQSGQFPKPVRIGKRAVRWRAEDLAAWRASLGAADQVSASVCSKARAKQRVK